MRIACAALLVLALGCHKGTNATATTEGSGSSVASGSGSAGGSATATGSGSTATGSGSVATGSGSAATGNGGAATGSAAASPELVAALDDLDRWLAPVLKLDTHPRIVALAKAQPTLLDKTQKLAAMSPPSGVTPDAWSQAVGAFKDQIDGVGLCTQNLAGYDKMSKAAQTSADDGYEECTQRIPETFAAIVKLVPGAPAPGTHANDPAMTPPAK
jgi:hypothetical protein